MSVNRQIKRGNLQVIQLEVPPYVSVVKVTKGNNRKLTLGRKRKFDLTLRSTSTMIQILKSGKVIESYSKDIIRSIEKRLKFKPGKKELKFNERTVNQKISFLRTMV